MIKGKDPRKIMEDAMFNSEMGQLNIDASELDYNLSITQHKEEDLKPVEKSYSETKPIGENFKSFGELYPKSEFSMWYTEMISVAQAKQEFKQQLAAAFVRPDAMAAMYSTLLSLWQGIKHGLPDKDAGSIREMFKTLRKKVAYVSDRMRSGQQIPSREYYETIDACTDIYELLEECQAKLNLKIRFSKKQRFEDIIEKFGSDPSRAISGNSPGKQKAEEPEEENAEPEQDSD